MVFGNIAVDDIGKGRDGLIDERAAVDHQRVVSSIDEDAYQQTLVLPQAGRFVLGELHARRDLTTDNRRSHAVDTALPVAADSDGGTIASV